MEENYCYGCMEKKTGKPFCEHCGYDERTPNAAHHLPAGTVLREQYLVGKVLGQGGFGITYLGRDLNLNIPIAIKEYYPSGMVNRENSYGNAVLVAVGDEDARFAENRTRFLREAQTLARLRNVPEVVQVMNFFSENNTAYIIMSYVEGITLKEHMRRQGGCLSAEETFRLLRPLMEAMEQVHKAGLVHRDISPDNIMLQPDGKVRLIDFGAAHEATGADGQSTQAVLKHGFAPMEQYQSKGNLGPWTDVYAMCATVYCCLTGKQPPHATDRIMGEGDFRWEEIPSLTAAQRGVLQQGVALEYGKRIPSMRQLCDRLFCEKPVNIPKPAQKPAAKALPAEKQRDKRPAMPPSGREAVYETGTIPLRRDGGYTAPVHREAPVLNATAAVPPRKEKPSGKKPKNKWKALSLLLTVTVLLLGGALAARLIAVQPQAEEKTGETAGAARESSIPAANQEEPIKSEAEMLLAQAELLAQGYDYDGAIMLLDSFSGNLSDYEELVAAKSNYVSIRDTLVEHNNPATIPNLSFHVLIHDPARAYADKDLGGAYNRNFVTTQEFQLILEQLYKNNFVLVDYDSFVSGVTDLEGNANFFPVPIRLPDGKKPVMITETMVNYFDYMIDGNMDGTPDAGGDGFASRLVVDANGDIKAEYVDINNETRVGNYDLVPILEDFIKQHPDFSYQGARATLAVTGDQGVFGYRTNTSYIASVSNEFYEKEVLAAKEVVAALRNKGYRIACYTYKNESYNQLNANQILADLTQWNEQITPILGQVDTIVFARESDIGDYSGPKFNLLYTNGFRIMVTDADTPYAEVNNTFVRQSRLMVTGNTMAWKSSQFTNLGLFDPNVVLDMANRKEVPN